MNELLLRIVISQTWQIAVLTIMVAAIVRIAARNRPHLAHALWILVLIKCVTPPLWGHSLGVFSHIQELAAPEEVAAEIEDANRRVDTIEVDELANPEASLEMPEMADSEAMISTNDELLESQFDAEPQRREVGEETRDDETQTDLASLGLNDSTLEIPPLEPEAEAHAAEQPPSPTIDQRLALLFGGFFIGSIITLTTMVIRCLRCLQQIRLHQTTEFDDVLRDRIQQLAKQLRIRRIPRIVVSDVLFGPAVLGLLRHTIVLPRCLFDDVGDAWRAERRKSPDDVTLPVIQRQQSEDLRPAARQKVLESGPADFDLHFLDPILAHELLHIRRGDLRTGTLQAIAQSLWWFHPAVWFCNRWLSREAERCCDEQVIAELGCTPAHYARSLLSVIECKHRLQPIPVFPGMKPVEITSQRMERIMSLKNGLKKRTPIWCWLMIVALAFVVLPGAVAKPSVDEIESNEANADTKLLQKDDVEAQLPEFEGNLFWNDADLQKHLGEREQANDVDIAATLAADCETIKSKYRGVGYFDVEVEATTSPADNPTNRRVQFQIKEGSQYKIREIRYEGNARINASDLQQSSNLKPGDMYSAFEASKDIQRIREQYKRLGLQPATINPAPQFSEESGLVDLVFEIDEGLTALVRLDESYIPTPELVLTGDTVLASVGDKKITIADISSGILPQLDKDTKVTPEQRQQILTSLVGKRLPGFIYDEIVLHEFRQMVPPDTQTEICKRLEPHFNVFLKQMGIDSHAKNSDDLESVFVLNGVSVESLRNEFMRRQIVDDYIKSLPAECSLQDRGSIETHCRQLLFEARLRQKISLRAENKWLPFELMLLEEKYRVQISRAAIYDLDRSVTVTAHLVDQPLFDVIKAIVEPNGFQVAVGNEEVIITAKPKDEPIAETPEPSALRVPVMPLPDWIESSSDPLVKLVWDARNASQRRLLMTDQRTPWQFMNGLAALRGNFLIREGDEAVVGLDWLQNCKAFPGQQWFQKSEFGGQPNPNPAPLWFDGHAAQFVATLAMNDVPLNANFATADGTITVGDMVKHLQVTLNERELTPWTLIALSKYLPRNEKWSNADGDMWSIERLVQIELDKENYTVTPLSLMSLAVARNRYFPAEGILDGIWQQADQRILAAIEKSMPKQTSDGRIITTYAPKFQSPHFQYRSQFGPRIPTLKSTPTYIDQAQIDLEGQRRIRLAAFPTDIRATNRAEMLLFLTLALPTNQLGEDWVRREIETAANELIADWSDQEIRSPFYEATQIMTVYFQRIPAAGISAQLDSDKQMKVSVQGLIQKPGTYEAPAKNGMRVLDAIAMAGGAIDESAEVISVFQKTGKRFPQSIRQANLERVQRGADPNFLLIDGDEVLLQPADVVTKPLASSIRLENNFALSPDAAISGDTVVAFVNDRPVTVQKLMGSGFARLEKTPGFTDSLKRLVVCESVASRLPEFVYQEIIFQYFKTDVPNLDQEISHREREIADKHFADALESPAKPTADPRMQARFISTLVARDTMLETRQREIHVKSYVLRLHNSSTDAIKSAVIKHVQELVTTARLRSLVSVDYTNTTLAEVLRSVKKNHDIEIRVKSLHEQISQRIFDQPGAIDFHAENKPLGEALTAIVSPFGLALSLDGSNVLLQFADSELAMEKFRSLPDPPSFGVFGVLKNPGWHPLTEEIRLLEALAIAGDIENSDGVSIEITNPDILSGKAKPVSMSLKVLQNDKSGKLNRVVKDGDLINVVRNSSAEAARAKAADRVKMQGKGITADSGVGTFHIDEASSLQLEQAMAKRRNIKLRMLKNAAQLSTASSTDEIVQLERKKRELELELENVPTVMLSGTGIVQAASVSVAGSSGKRTNSNDDETQKENNGTHGIAPASTNASLELCSYPVADLVNYRQPVIAKIVRSSAEKDPARQSVISASTLLSTPEQSANQGAPKPPPQLPLAQDTPLNLKADFAPLTELIKATVQPKSWDTLGRALIAVDEKTSSLVIRQTPSAHGEICDLLSQLRSADDHMVSIQSLILKLTDDAQLKWLGTQCSLHTFPNETQWALLSKERSQVLTRELLELKPEVVSRPKMVTISAQMAAIQIGQSNKIDGTTTGIRMEMTPHLLPGNKIIRLQHAAQIGKLSAEVLLPVESLVGSGQTLLLLLDAVSENKEPEVPTSKYLLLITPEYVPLLEEEETLSKPHPDTKTELNP